MQGVSHLKKWKVPRRSVVFTAALKSPMTHVVYKVPFGHSVFLLCYGFQH